jgi:hypothetical protein
MPPALQRLDRNARPVTGAKQIALQLASSHDAFLHDAFGHDAYLHDVFFGPMKFCMTLFRMTPPKRGGGAGEEAVRNQQRPSSLCK